MNRLATANSADELATPSAAPRKRSALMKRFLKFLIIGFLILVCAIVYVRKIEPNWVDITQVSVTIPQLGAEFEGYKIVQITDVHADNWMNADRLSRLVATVNRQAPDLIAMTGDYVTKGAEEFAPTLQAFDGLKAKDAVLAVLGNHDQWTDAALLTQALQNAQVEVLKNAIHTVQRGTARLNIAGVGDVWSGQADLPGVIQQMPTLGPAIMLAHEPDFADETSATGRFSLQLSGHSHGGQVHLPLVPRVVPRMAEKYPSGRYQVGELVQYTSRGVGMVHPRIRFNCRPEVTVLTLHSAA
jgi:uncharacterized protein